MKPIRLLALLLFPLLSLGQNKFVERITFEGNLGLGFATNTSPVIGSPAYLALSASVITAGRWVLIPEANYLAFRDPYDQDKSGLFLPGYARHQFGSFGLQIGKVLLDDSLGFHIVISAGADLMQVGTPRKVGSGLFGSNYEYTQTNLLNVPIQVAFRAPTLPRRVRRVTLDVLVTVRWNANSYHSFPTLSVGPSVGFYTTRRRRY